MGLLEKIFGNYSDKEIKKIIPVVDKIESLETEISKLSDEELRAKTDEFKKRVQEQGESLDSILPEAFAVVREGSKRVLGMRHFRVQLIGGIVLHQGRISEMKTGEGKTLVATLPAYLNAINGKGVHVVTVNDYLAKRDAETMTPLYNFLGLTCGVILNDMKPDQRREAYNSDITYATNNELGFDYLRDNMVVRRENMVQRDLAYAIIDEVDSVLIDEARTPLIISGSGDKSTQLYKVADTFVKMLKKGRILNEEDALNPLIKEELKEEGDFVVDEKAKSVVLTQDGVKKAEKFFNLENLSDPENLEIQHHINNALKANYNMHLDKDYVVSDDEILIVDEFTGRIMPGRRYSDGLHQAIEAKENVKVKRESKTLATVTFQNFFNKYEKKSGMTGTAQTEESEFRNIYGLDVVVIPTNRPVQRIDKQDVVYRTEAGKFRAVVRDVVEAHKKGQPVLVGTVTIDKSEQISKMLKREGIPHQVLNAKYHEKEAEIVALAGQKGAVTIATNMAGRGTDIKLGEGVQELGGLKIIGTERHESRRIDNQLRGRAGRQGDPGESRFFISMEDDLMRLFGSERTMKLVDAMGLEEDDPIEHGMLTKAIENAQKKVEGNNFAVRKHLLDYDEVMNEQRELIYGERRRVLFGENLRDSIMTMIKEFVDNVVERCLGEITKTEEWDMTELNEQINAVIPMGFINIKDENSKGMTKDKLKETLEKLAIKMYEDKEKEIGDDEKMRELERVILLRVIDQKWMDHIDDMDQMRQGIGLHAYAQRDPLIEYKYAAYDMFNEMSENIQNDTIKTLYHVRVVTEPVMVEEKQQVMFTNRDDSAQKKPVERKEEKIGRNDPCPCGSGLKYKQCCGKND
ncbi:MAG: preprotein translocase subunit SecA [Tyzzerella sp.]|uniref:Protein translocase subunit SecA n=1 Tax=Candidatus Fimicola merdigallinarum TaxID=2840819 RepID=A0A9D9DVG7_9FIRM|nr:preprotein translocase subunit SecA [Candidatus Fimicola merdigallinarum]